MAVPSTPHGKRNLNFQNHGTRCAFQQRTRQRTHLAPELESGIRVRNFENEDEISWATHVGVASRAARVGRTHALASQSSPSGRRPVRLGGDRTKGFTGAQMQALALAATRRSPFGVAGSRSQGRLSGANIRGAAGRHVGVATPATPTSPDRTLGYDDEAQETRNRIKAGHKVYDQATMLNHVPSCATPSCWKGHFDRIAFRCSPWHYCAINFHQIEVGSVFIKQRRAHPLYQDRTVPRGVLSHRPPARTARARLPLPIRGYGGTRLSSLRRQLGRHETGQTGSALTSVMILYQVWQGLLASCVRQTNVTCLLT